MGMVELLYDFLNFCENVFSKVVDLCYNRYICIIKTDDYFAYWYDSIIV